MLPYGPAAATLLRLEGRPVEFVRGASRVCLTAVIGNRRDMLDAPTGRIEVTLHEFLVQASALTIAGEETKPQRGDKIEHDGERFDVVPEGLGPAWEWHDPHKTLVLIRTRKGGVA